MTRYCTCGKRKQSWNPTCSKCTKYPKNSLQPRRPHALKRWLAEDISDAEIEQRYQAALGEIRSRRKAA